MYSRGPAVLCADPSTAAAHLLWLTSGRVVIQHQGVFMKSAHTHTHQKGTENEQARICYRGALARALFSADARWTFTLAFSKRTFWAADRRLPAATERHDRYCSPQLGGRWRTRHAGGTWSQNERALWLTHQSKDWLVSTRVRNFLLLLNFCFMQCSVLSYSRRNIHLKGVMSKFSLVYIFE